MKNEISLLDIANILLRYNEMDVYGSFLLARQIRNVLTNSNIDEIKKRFPNLENKFFDDLKNLLYSKD